MKKYIEPSFPAAETLRGAVPPVRRGFEKEMMFLLRTLPEERKEKTVKYKISMSFALALLILFLTCATAFAITNWEALQDYFEKVTDMGWRGSCSAGLMRISSSSFPPCGRPG